MNAVQQDAFAGTPYQRPRPRRYDKYLRRAAAEALVPEIARWLGEDLVGVDREKMVETLARSCGEDGYEIARELEREGYTPNAELVEILDGFDTHRAHAEAVRVWLVETGAKPQLAVGAVVTIPSRMKEHEGVTGEIVRIDEQRGEYTICCVSLGHVRAGMGTHGLVFPWEEVESCSATSAAQRGSDR